MLIAVSALSVSVLILVAPFRNSAHANVRSNTDVRIYESLRERAAISSSVLPSLEFPNPLNIQEPFSSIAGSWLSEADVTPPDDYVDGGQSLAVDRNGVPWLVWYRKIRNSYEREVAYWSRWDLDHWLAPELVDSTYTGWVHKPRITFDSDNVAWVVWNEHEGSEIWFTRRENEVWATSQRVHQPDPFNYYSPEIACGGGQVWLTWYGNDGHNEYDIFVTQWNGSTWDPPENLTQGIPGFHWFCDIVVDDNGAPHLLWGNSSTNQLLYTFRPNGESWHSSELINSGSVIADGWPMSDIKLDGSGRVHVTWIGRTLDGASGYGDSDVYYSARDAAGWNTETLINESDEDWAYYPEIAVQDSSDVWITWGDEGSSWTNPAAIYIAHYDGVYPSGETRLDSGRFWWNQVPRIALANREPWVVWGAIHQDFNESALLYSRYFGAVVPVLLSSLRGVSGENGVDLTWWAEASAFSAFDVERSQGGPFETVGQLEVLQEESYRWTDTSVTGGSYTYRIAGFLLDGGRLLLGPIQVLVSEVGFSLETSGLAKGSIEMQVGMSVPGNVTIALYNVAGRLVHAQRPEFMEAGWHRRKFDLGSTKLAPGVYLLKASSGDRHRSSRVTFLR